MSNDGAATYDEFFRGCHRRLLSQAFLFTADDSRAQDLTQEAFEKTWVHWKRVAGLDDPEAWTRRVLYNLCISDWRKATRRAAIRGTPRQECFPPPDDTHLAVVAALRMLSPDQARALVLHDGLGFSVPEVAAQLSAPEGTVKSWISRGRAHAALALTEPQPTSKDGVTGGR